MSIESPKIEFTTENTFHFGCRNGTQLVYVLLVSDHSEHNARSSASTTRVTDVIHRQQLVQPPGHINSYQRFATIYLLWFVICPAKM